MKKRIFEFTVVLGDTEYKSEREVTGQRVLRQTISVAGIGSKSDSARYQSNSPRTSSMESVARLIANEIINGQ